MNAAEVTLNHHLLLSYLAVYARWTIGGMLLVAGVIKVQDLREFEVTIQAFRLIPKQWSKLAARIIVNLELLTSLCLLVGVGVHFAAIGGVVLFSTFTLAVLVNLIRHNIFDCNCFGPYFRHKISLKTLSRNLLLITLCLWILHSYDGYLALESWLFGQVTTQNHSWQLFFLATVVMILLGLCILSLRITLKNFKLVKSDSGH